MSEDRTWTTLTTVSGGVPVLSRPLPDPEVGFEIWCPALNITSKAKTLEEAKKVAELIVQAEIYERHDAGIGLPDKD